MKYLKTYEQNKSLYYDYDNAGGSIQGIIHYDISKIDNWFSKRYMDPSEYDKYLNIPVAFLNNINVDDEYRGKGYGSDLYYKFEEFCEDNDVKSIILESDSLEDQQEGFILDKWYESLGFKKIGVNYDDSIMYKEL